MSNTRVAISKQMREKLKSGEVDKNHKLVLNGNVCRCVWTIWRVFYQLVKYCDYVLS